MKLFITYIGVIFLLIGFFLGGFVMSALNHTGETLLQEKMCNNATNIYQTYHNATTIKNDLRTIHNTTNYYSYNFNLRETPDCKYKTELRQIVGDSMQPYLADGEFYYVDHAPFEELTRHDVVEFMRDGESITHAVYYLHDKYMLTQGYRNLHETERVEKGDYLARVCRK